MTYDLNCLWESAKGHTLLSDPDAIRTEGPDSGALMKLSWESCVTGIYPRNVRLVHEGAIRLIQQLYSWDYGGVLGVSGFGSSRLQFVIPAPC